MFWQISIVSDLNICWRKKTTSRLVQLLAGCADVLLGGLSWRRRWRGLPDCTTDIIPSGAKSAFSTVSLQQGFSTREPQWGWSRRTEFHWQLDSEQDHLRMNVAPDQTIMLGQQIFLDHRLLSSIGQKIMMMVPPPSPLSPFLPLFPMVFFTEEWWKDGWMDHAPYIVTISRAPTAMDPCWLLGMGTFSVELPYTKTYVCHAFANFWAIS